MSICVNQRLKDFVFSSASLASPAFEVSGERSESPAVFVRAQEKAGSSLHSPETSNAEDAKDAEEKTKSLSR